MRASRARPAALSISVGAARVGISLGRRVRVALVDDHRVDQPRVERGDAGRGRGPADRLHEALGRALHDLAGDDRG